MRGLWSTILLAAVLLGLGAYIYLTMARTPADADSGGKLFPTVQADRIDEIHFKPELADATTLKKTGGGWQIVEPVTAPAEASDATFMASNLASATITRVVEDNPTNLEIYGLARPQIDVVFKSAGDTDAHHLLIGEPSPTGRTVFLKRENEKRVLLGPLVLHSMFNRSAFDLRDKAIIKFDRDKVDRIEVNTGGRTLRLVKDGRDWKILTPAAHADFAAVAGLMARLETARMTSIVSSGPGPADLKRYGLDAPTTTVVLTLGAERAELALGREAGDDAVYVREMSKTAVMTVEKSFADDIRKGADEYRHKDVFPLGASAAQRLEVTGAAGTVVFERVTGANPGPQKWRRLGPTASDVSTSRVEGLLSRLSNLRAASFVDSTAKTGLDAPALTVVVTFEDKREERVSFGQTGRNVYVSIDGDAGAAKIEATAFTEVVRALEALESATEP